MPLAQLEVPGMDLLKEYQFNVEHQHNDGSWSPLDEDRDHHGSAALDVERGWIQRVFRCTTCQEVVRIRPRGQPPAPDAE